MNKAQLAKHQMTFFIYVSLVPLVYFVPQLLAPYLPNNAFLQVMIVLAVIVPIVSYIILPLIGKFISNR